MRRGELKGGEKTVGSENGLRRGDLMRGRRSLVEWWSRIFERGRERKSELLRRLI